VHKRKEIVQDVTLHDLDAANARPQGGQVRSKGIRGGEAGRGACLHACALSALFFVNHNARARARIGQTPPAKAPTAPPPPPHTHAKPSQTH
jgi:hypothetical protein